MKKVVKKDSQRLDNVVIEGKKAEFSVGEIKHSNRIVKSKTPKGDLSWYVKWISSAFIFVAVAFRSTAIPELQIYDIILSWLGCAGWFCVGMLWKDRALILLNGVSALMLFSSVLRYTFG